MTSTPTASLTTAAALGEIAANFVLAIPHDRMDDDEATAQIEKLKSLFAQVRRDVFDEAEESIRMLIAAFPDKTEPIDRAHYLGMEAALSIVQCIRALSPSPVRAGGEIDAIQDAISDWLISLGDLSTGLRGKHAAALRDAIVAVIGRP